MVDDCMKSRKRMKQDRQKAASEREKGFWFQHGVMITLSVSMTSFAVMVILDYSDDQIVQLRSVELPWLLSIGLVFFFSIAAVISVFSTIKDIAEWQRNS